MRKEAMSGLGIARATDFARKMFSGFPFGQGSEKKGRFAMNAKKIMAALAVTGCALAGYSDVSSSNIVGYQNQGYDHAEYSIAANSFGVIGKDRANMKIGDIKPNEDFVYSFVSFLTAKGATAKVDFKGKQVSANYIYWFEGDEPTDGEGWYLESDEDTEINQNEAVSIPFGTGFMVYRMNDEADANLTYSGEVQSKPMTRGFDHAEYAICGNCSPVDLKLGDITVNEDFVYSFVSFLTAKGATAKVDFKGKQVSANYIYWTEDDEPADGAGWYLEADEDTEINQNEVVELKAGQGFMVYRMSDETDAELTVPAPIAE